MKRVCDRMTGTLSKETYGWSKWTPEISSRSRLSLNWISDLFSILKNESQVDCNSGAEVSECDQNRDKIFDKL